jgi:hypothetical protein
MATRIITEDSAPPPFISIEFTRDENKPQQVTLSVKSNMGIRDEPPAQDGKGAAPYTLPQLGEDLMQGLVTALSSGPNRLTVRHDAKPQVAPEEDPPHAKSAFLLTATIEVGTKDDQVLDGIFKAAIVSAKSKVAHKGYGNTSDKQGGQMAGM